TATDLGGNVFTSEYDATSGTWKRVKGPAVTVQGQPNPIQETLVEYLTFDAWDRGTGGTGHLSEGHRNFGWI
ncbi:MAG TPA: hypothetical protein PLX89_26635, partial [Verrucomicrobiota bacterium]|nr:hypothetical protein [Verrucomicrobiota bacterium]